MNYLNEIGTEVFNSEEIASAPTVYSELESVAKLIFSFVPRSFG